MHVHVSVSSRITCKFGIHGYYLAFNLNAGFLSSFCCQEEKKASMDRWTYYSSTAFN